MDNRMGKLFFKRKSLGTSLVPYIHLSYGLSPEGDTAHVKFLVKFRIFLMSFH